MPWPCKFEYVLGSVGISILNIATERTDMGSHRQRLLNDFPTLIAFLRGVAGIDSDDLMPSILSFDREDINELSPTGIRNGLRNGMILHHVIDIQIFNGNEAMMLGILLRHFEVEITTLPLNLQMGLSRTLGGLTPPLRPFLASTHHPLLTPDCPLALAVVPRVLYSIPLGISEERFQPHINTNTRVFAHGWKMLGLRLNLTDDESVPMPISS